MVQLNKILEPNKFKIILSALFFIPILALLLLIFKPNFLNYVYFGFYNPFQVYNLIMLAMISIFFSYFSASLIDYKVASKNAKLTIAITSGLVSLLIMYVFYKMISEPIVCDPIHQPSQGSSYHSQILNDINVDQKTVEESLKQCLSKLGK
jgi:ABC-type transport system involved in multi-copper enzyme maturation permease subunit